ncbi:MAG: hypothetical protein J6A59_05530 [Lachnospiraceae bacterium]|nr:hypothetical protein [Lachnospiraceae bacterium]
MSNKKRINTNEATSNEKPVDISAENVRDDAKTQGRQNSDNKGDNISNEIKKTVAGVVVSQPEEPETQHTASQENNQPSKSTTEDNLELRRMSFTNRIKAKQARLKANTEGMSTWEKFKYYVYYYKWHVILGLILLFCAIAIPTAIYKNSRPVAISYAVVNSPEPERINEKLFNEYTAHYGLVEGYQIRNSLSVTLSQADYETEFAKEEGDSSYTQFPTLCWNNYYDIIITNETGLHYCTVNSLVQPLEDRLYDDIYEEIKSKYPKRIIQSPNYDEYPVEFAIDISDTEFVKKLNVGYDNVYVCFPGGSEENIVSIRRFLKYVLNLDIEI